MKKKFVSLVVILGLTAGTVQVYAASVLGTNIIDLIKDGFTSIRSYYEITVNDDASGLKDQYRDEIGQYAGDKTDEIIGEIESHKNNEITRASEELDSYIQIIKQETDSIAEQQIEESKAKITEDVNKGIEDIKTEINKELEKQLKEKLKK